MMLRITRGTEARKPGLRGEREGNRKTVARGMPDRFGKLAVTTLVCFLFFARETAGAASIRHSLRPPLLRRVLFNDSGAAAPRECEGVSLAFPGCCATRRERGVVRC